jgi:hypothetical protein
MALERHFFVEAKTFLFSVEEGKSVLRMEERRKGFLGVVLLGLQCIAWVIAAVKDALQSKGVEDFVKSFWEDLKAWKVRKGCNKDGCFLELAVYAVGGWRGFILFPEGRGGRGWNRVADELCKVMVFLETTTGSSAIGVLSPGDKKDGKEVLGLKVSSPSSGGAWPFLGGALPSFAEVVRSKGPVKLGIPLVEWHDLDLLPAVRLAASEEVRLAMDCYVLEKESLGKDLMLNLQSKGLPARLPSAQGTLGSARKSLPSLKLWTWREPSSEIGGSGR